MGSGSNGSVVLRNRYRILRRLGAGGGGSVYRVEDLRGAGEPRPELALKALFGDDRGETLLGLLRQEFRVLATLRHPLLARVYDFGSFPAESGLEGALGRPGYFFTRDLIDGEDLATYGRDRSVLELCLVCQRAAQVLDILHRAGIVHGDFKPANVIVSSDGRPHLIDFGLVRGEGQISGTSGTAAYFSPEMLRGAKVDRRADLYALGVTLYQLLVGHLPLPEATLGELVAWHLNGPVLQASPEREVPAELDRVLARLTERDPEQRYPSAAEVALALGEVVTLLGGASASVEERLFVPPPPGENLQEAQSALEVSVRRRIVRLEGGPALVSLAGEPGSGRSTVLRELAWRCQLGGVEVIRGDFQAGDPRAYGLLSDLLAQVAGLVGLASPLGQEAARAAPAGEADRYGLYQQMSDFLSAAARRVPLLLLVDGADQADRESQAALRYLGHTLEERAPVLLVAGYRADEGVRDRLGQPPEVVLRPLSVAELSRMLAVASGRSDAALAERIHQLTSGNPLFSMEVLRRLCEAGWPPRPDLQKLAPPRGLEEVYARRYGELSGDEQAVLAALAVLGRPSSGMALLALLEAASETGRELQVGLPLERLEAEEWILRHPDGAWGFRQGPASRLIYGWVRGERRAALHRAALKLLERSGEGNPVECARHALGAEVFALAAPHLERALASLRAVGAHQRAIELCEAAVALPQPAASLRATRRQLGELYRGAADYERAREELELACEGAEGSELTEAAIALSRVYRAEGQAERALAVLEESLARELTRAERLQALSAKAAVLTALEHHEGVLEAVDRALTLEREEASLGRPDALSRADLRRRRAWALGQLARYDEAGETMERALADARACGDRRAEANILNGWAAVDTRRGDFSRVAERYGAALACAQEVGDVERVAAVRFNLAAYHLQRGEYAACLQHLEESSRLFTAMGAQQNEANARCNLAYLELKLGLYEQARVSLARTRELMRRLGRPGGEALAVLLTGIWQARRGRLDEARREIDEARRLYLEVGQKRDAADALLDLAEAELLVGEPQAAREALDRAGREVTLEQLGDLAVRAVTLRARAVARIGSAEEKAASAAALAGALDQARALESPELLWQCHGAAHELEGARGQVERAGRHAREGAAILRSMAHELPPEVQAAFFQDPWRRALRKAAAKDQLTELGRTMQAGTRDHDVNLAATLPTFAADEAPRSHPPQERFYRLLEIYRRIASELDLERLLGLVMDAAVELTGAERGFLLLRSPTGELAVEVARNIDPERGSGAYSRTIAERVISSGQPVITVSARNDPRFSEYASVAELQLESVLCIPIHARDTVAGVLYMESRFQTGRFTPEDQRLLVAFGDQVAIALTNARLIAENLRNTKALEQAKREIEQLAEERGRLLEKRTHELAEAQRDLAETKRRIGGQKGRLGIIGASEPMQRVFDLVERVAVTDVPVLIEGESGTGKEMVARAIHQASERVKGRLVSVNCAAIPETLLESELFGHVRGAFTGADRDRKGLFTNAHGGTLFLDEIGDMPPRMQVDLLRALQEKTIRPVGGQQDLQVDVRVIAASNKPLRRLVQQGTFREDLFYRLHVVRIGLPPLRERPEDIPLLVDHFLEGFSGQLKTERKRVTREALRALMSYTWPGNVRQLEHALMNAVVLSEGSVLDARDFTLEAPVVAEVSRAAPAPSTSDERSDAERREILSALEAHNWNRSRAAEALGIPRRTFYRRLKDYGIQ
ncbi:MAG: sigma 54-interacting transcriptional regulator [Deltaproteobacteria bacterium]|nr:sigma 54-interacting transcriptional regulator [Deltaproteobacteria bacterium]